ncbi:hypothetical protein [Hymenobacter jeollabukensis]|uniref:Uncharacterized protein n=1 Tax=Hymenobacter jeollabukensis TaxID=2025313 RepID=A0A5R8WN31_9BACT|nr:hypothetical protein [Hymenobacter jeollabukensis]TLM91036.1 hypothetical protein FDY95_15655 [Hymenobacter jeollabukensis]
MPCPMHPANSWRILRVYAEASGAAVALILVTHTRTGTDVYEVELPYLLWESLGTRAAAGFVTRLYRSHCPESVRHLGLCAVRRRIASGLAAHHHQLAPGPDS